MDCYEEFENVGKEERRQMRLEMCGKPYYRRSFSTGNLEKFYPRCKEWRICDFCFGYRVDEEMLKLTLAGEVCRVEVEANWNTVYRYMHRRGIAYRRYAKGLEGEATVLLRPNDAEKVAEHFGFRVRKFTVDERTVRVLLRHVPMHKGITGELGRPRKSDAEIITMQSWAIRLDGADDAKVFRAWSDVQGDATLRADFDSLVKWDKVRREAKDCQERESATVKFVKQAEKMDEDAIVALAKRLMEMGEVVTQTFRHKRRAVVNEMLLLGTESFSRLNSDRYAVVVTPDMPQAGYNAAFWAGLKLSPELNALI